MTSQHRLLYTGYERSGYRGYSSHDRSEARFLATLVLAIYQTKMEGDAGMHRVFVFFPSHQVSWYRKQLSEVCRYAASRRRGKRAACKILDASFGSLVGTSRMFQIAEPDRWAIFGFRSDDLIPPWVQGRLL